jgi:hypothetical protein
VNPLSEIEAALSRRKFVKNVSAAGIAGLLAGCAGTGGEAENPAQTSTATATSTATETDTATETATETPEPEQEYWIELPFQEHYRSMIPSSDSQIAADLEENFPFKDVEQKLDDAPDHRYAEIIVAPLGETPIRTGAGHQGAKNTAAGARYVMHRGISQDHRKPVDPDHSDSYHAFPVSFGIGNEIFHGADIHNDNGLTTVFPSNGETGEENILNPNELDLSQSGNGQNLSQNELRLGAQYISTGHHDTYRWENFDSVMNEYEDGASPVAVDNLHMEYGKLVPGLYDGGIPSNAPIAWMARSGVEELDREVIQNYNGVDYLVHLHNEFQREVTTEQKGKVHERNGSLNVEAVPEEEYDNSQPFAAD